MPIQFTVVSKDGIILAEHRINSIEYTPIIEHILTQVPPYESKMTYVYDRNLYHYISKDGIVFLCMAEDGFGRRVPFAFLDELIVMFDKRYGKSFIQSKPYFLEDFSADIRAQMDFFNSEKGSDKIKKVQGELDYVKDVMVQNIEKVLERGERIEILVDKTENLNQTSVSFRNRSVQLRRQMWWENSKITMMLVIGTVMMFFVMGIYFCGFPFFDKCLW